LQDAIAEGLACWQRQITTAKRPRPRGYRWISAVGWWAIEPGAAWASTPC